MAFRHPSEKVKALVASADPSVKALFDKQEEFTITESIFLKSWLQAVLEGKFDLAERLVDHGARAEHFRSLLSEFAPNIHPDALAIQTALNQEFDTHLKEFRDREREPERPRDERPEIGYSDRPPVE